MGDGSEVKKTTDEMVADYIATHITESDKDSRLISKLGALAALVGSIATLIGALAAASSANKADETAQNVEKLLLAFQQSKSIKDHRQMLLDENGALLNLYNEKELGVMCTPIPLDDSALWNNYEYCILSGINEGKVSLGSSSVPSALRRTCGLKLEICNKI